MDKPLDTSDSTVPVITVTPSARGKGASGKGQGGAKFLDAFKTTSQSTSNTQISDSYNTTTSTVTSNSVGDSSLSIGNQGGGTTETVALVVGAIALLGGLYLFTR